MESQFSRFLSAGVVGLLLGATALSLKAQAAEYDYTTRSTFMMVCVGEEDRGSFEATRLRVAQCLCMLDELQDSRYSEAEVDRALSDVRNQTSSTLLQQISAWMQPKEEACGRLVGRT